MEEDYVGDHIALNAVYAHPHAQAPQGNVTPAGLAEAAVRLYLERNGPTAVHGQRANALLGERHIWPGLVGVVGAPRRCEFLLGALEIWLGTTADARDSQGDVAHDPSIARGFFKVVLLSCPEDLQPVMRIADCHIPEMLARPTQHQRCARAGLKKTQHTIPAVVG